MAYKKKAAVSEGAPKRRSWNPNYKKSTVVPGSQYKPCLTPSDEQKDIFDAVVDGSGSLLVNSYAGCGKTTTCVEAMYRVQKKDPRIQQAYIIFANRNKEEAVGKCPASGVEVKTAHGFGLNALGRVYGKVLVDKEKTDRIATALVGPDDDKDELRYMVAKAIDLGKDYLATTPEEIDAIVDKHGIERGDLTTAEFADKVLKGMETSKQQPNVVSFSDMTWLPLVLGINIPSFDIVWADENQDLNKARIELVLRSLGSKGRLVGVGDEKQSIFGFSGADRHALATLKERSNATTMPLHRTYRCGRKIVELARQYVPDYEAAPTNPEGEVREISMGDMMDENGAQPGCFILSRTNAPITKIAMQLLKQGRRSNIQGKDLGTSLVYMIKRSKAKDVASFQSWLDDWANAEVERLSAKRKDYEHIVDKKECLEAFCEGERDLGVVKKKIVDMFADTEGKDGQDRVILSSIHRSKGLERKTVFLLESSFVVRPKTEEEVEQEANVRYVAITRAIEHLYLVG